MICKHNYYQLVDGDLVCIQCGKPAKAKIEDKMIDQHEDKQLYPAESKRLRGRPKRKR